MEDRQRQHITKNLLELMRNTNCNVDLISSLESQGFLSQNEVQLLGRPHLIQLEQARMLYDILLTKVDAYDGLMRSLEECRQSGALKILKNVTREIRHIGSISYDKNNLLGKGSYGTAVYCGQYDDTTVAVKIVNCDQAESSQALREIDILKGLEQDENILRYYFAERSDNYVYIALELCDISLQDEVKANMLNMDPYEILRKCMSGLAHLHKYNILHRDIKPANILLKRPGQVKISDFGLSKKISPGRTSVSAVTGVVGTAEYMAPEILGSISENGACRQPVKMTNSCDIFALGCVFYFTLTKGLHPFGNVWERMNNIVNNSPKLDHSLVSEDWMQLIKLMISHEPNERPSAENIPAILSCFQESASQNNGIEMREQGDPFVFGDVCPEGKSHQSEAKMTNGNVVVQPQPNISAPSQSENTKRNSTDEPWNGEWTEVAGVQVPRLNGKKIMNYFMSRR